MQSPSLSSVSATVSAWYDRLYDDFEKSLIVPVLMVLFVASVLGMSYMDNGEIVGKGIDFTGGTEIQFQVPADVTRDDLVAAFPEDGTTIRTMSGAGDGNKWMIVETKEVFSGGQDNTQGVEEAVKNRLNNHDIPYEGEISVRTLGAAVGAAFFQQAVFWSGVALLIMSVVIFIAFRSLVPSFAVIFAAVTDIAFALAGMNILGIDLTLGSLAALLMLLGYSVDTDILLSTRVLKQRKESMKGRVKKSILTGSTMSIAAIVAFSVLYIVSPAVVLDQIAAVIIIGLVADLPITWLGNAVILKMYVER